MRSAKRRLIALVAGTPVVLTLLATIYMLGMERLEGSPRTFWQSFEWASETVTTTGYGHDAQWQHPLMIVFVSMVQVLGVSLTFIVVSLLVLPFFEARFEGRLPRSAPKLRDYVLIYRWGPAVASLVDELTRAKVGVLVLEEDETVARRLLDRGRKVVVCRLEEEDPEPSLFANARAIVANGTDAQNGAFVLAARQRGYAGELVALAQEPLHRAPMMLAGAAAVYTPLHILAAAIAGLASERIATRVSGLSLLGSGVQATEVRVDRRSEFAGKTLAQADLRSKSGATIIAKWSKGVFVPHCRADTVIEPGAILVAVGDTVALERLAALAPPLPRTGPIVVCGHGEVGRKLVELLRDAGERVIVIDRVDGPGVDVVGNVLERATLERADLRGARAVIVALGDDATTLFAASVLRDFAAEVPLVARVNRQDNVERIHRAGADFAVSLAEVAGELLAHKLLGAQWSAEGMRVKLAKLPAGPLAGRTPRSDRIGERTGCSIVALERGGTIVTDFEADSPIEAGDALVVCGPEDALTRYLEIAAQERGG